MGGMGGHVARTLDSTRPAKGGMGRISGERDMWGGYTWHYLPTLLPPTPHPNYTHIGFCLATMSDAAIYT